MSKAAQLNDRPKDALASLAKRRGIRGWESMNKGELIKALSRGPGPSKPARSAAPAKKSHAARVTVKAAAKVTAKRPAKRPKLLPKVKLPKLPAKRDVPAKAIANGLHRPSPVANGSPKVAVKPATPPAGKLAAARAGTTKSTGAQTPIRELPARPSGMPTKDRIILSVNDPYWLHVMWDLSTHSIQRAEAALKQDWYGARLIIRLSDVTRHDEHLRDADSRHPHHRRWPQLVHQRPATAPTVPRRHRLHFEAWRLLRPGALQRRHSPQGGQL
jgi:uncharacterized protein